MKKIVFILLMLSVNHIHAGWQEGQVTEIVVRQSDGLHYFYMSGTGNDRPPCANSQTYWVIKNEGSVAGKSQLSLLLSAYATGKTVHVLGADSCSRWSDGEDVKTIHLR